MTTPIDRLRELHRRCSCWGENCGGVRPNVDANSHCAKCIVTYPCDTIAALDALDALLVVSPADLEAFALSTQSIIRHAEGKDTEIRALEARLDAATVLAEAVQWLIDEARGSREWRATRGMKPATDISRFKACSLSALIVIERELGRALSAWLAGDKEAGNE